MKKLKALLIALMILFFCPVAMAAVTETVVGYGTLWVHSFAWTAEANGSFTDYTSTNAIDGIILAVETDPGTPAPTDNYDITFTTEQDYAVAGTSLNDRDTVNTERWVPTEDNVPFAGKVKLDITNNSVNAAQGVIRVFVKKDKPH